MLKTNLLYNLKRDYHHIVAVIIPFFLFSCSIVSTQVGNFPKGSKQIARFEEIINKKDFSYLYVIDSYKCDKHDVPLAQSRLLKNDAVQATWQIQPAGAFKRVGGSGVFDFALQDNESFEYETSLGEHDLSQGLAISFLWKSNVLTAQHIMLKLRDASTEQLQTSTSIVPLSDGWVRIYFPLHGFDQVNLDFLQKVSIVIFPKTAITGQLYVDDMVMLGEKYFMQRSKEDNVSIVFDDSRVDTQVLSALSDQELLREIARRTWDFLAHATDKYTGLPLDRVDIEGVSRVDDYTSTTNIGLYIASCVAAEKMGFIVRDEMCARIERVLTSLEKLELWKNFYFNYYDTATLDRTDSFISSVDNGWLAIGLATARSVLAEDMQQRIDRIIEPMNFGLFYDKNLGHLNLGYDVKKEAFSEYHYGLLCTEARATSFWAIGKKDIPPQHWFKMYRTFPLDWTWQNGKPVGKHVFHMGEKVYEGFYQYKGIDIVPSWGGSMFEFLMPTLFLDEQHLGVHALGQNDINAVMGQITYAKNQRYALWGMSPSAIPGMQKYGYGEFGVSYLGAKGYPDKAVITPHATFLALPFVPGQAIANIRTMLDMYPALNGKYGFYDAINLKKEQIAKVYLCLDQSMILLSLCNFLEGNYIVNAFHAHKYVKKEERLLLMEHFFA